MEICETAWNPVGQTPRQLLVITRTLPFRPRLFISVFHSFLIDSAISTVTEGSEVVVVIDFWHLVHMKMAYSLKNTLSVFKIDLLERVSIK